MLEVRGLETAYGPSQVLFGVSLDIAKGQVATLLGRNGMGKTTTVRSIMGMLRPKAGKISFEGNSLQNQPSYRVAQLGLGLVPEGRIPTANLLLSLYSVFPKPDICCWLLLGLYPCIVRYCRKP